MKALIIEDEQLAAQALEYLIREVAPGMEILTILQSIDESIEWFDKHDMPDLIFMDIHLADGSSFAIFEQVSITCPVIFTTAYDQYALKAFEVNSVDYLLKPIHKKDLERAIQKYNRFYTKNEYRPDQIDLITKLMADIRGKNTPCRSSLLVAVKDKLIPLPTKDIAYIFIENKIVKAVTFESGNFVLNQTMEEIYSQLDRSIFYRANRQFIISRNAVKDLVSWFGNKLAVNLVLPTPERIYISRTNVREFKEWISY